MTKAEMVSKIATEFGLTKVSSANIYDMVVNSVVDTVKAEGRMSVSGLGVFKVVERKARVVNSFGKGEKEYPGYKTITFKAAPSIRKFDVQELPKPKKKK